VLIYLNIKGKEGGIKYAEEQGGGNKRKKKENMAQVWKCFHNWLLREYAQ